MKKILVATLFAALAVPFAFAGQAGSTPDQSQTTTKKKVRTKKHSHHKKNAKAASAETK